MKFAHTNLVANDWKKLSEFYIQVFDCVYVPPTRNQNGAWLDKGTGLNDASLQGVHLRLPGYGDSGPTLEIYQYKKVVEQKPVAPNQRGFGHIAFEVNDIHDLTQKVIKSGGSYSGDLVEKTVIGVGKLTFVYMRDPEGNLIELQHWNKVASHTTNP